MPKVDLESEEWQRLMAVLASAPWNVANPLLMKIGEQLRMAKFESKDQPPPASQQIKDLRQ